MVTYPVIYSCEIVHLFLGISIESWRHHFRLFIVTCLLIFNTDHLSIQYGYKTKICSVMIFHKITDSPFNLRNMKCLWWAWIENVQRRRWKQSIHLSWCMIQLLKWSKIALFRYRRLWWMINHWVFDVVVLLSCLIIRSMFLCHRQNRQSEVLH